MTRYINSRKYWHESCKNKGSQLSHRPHIPRFARADGER